jgi:hypothetical protein
MSALFMIAIPAEEENLLLNPGFEESFYGYASGWTSEAYKGTDEAVQFYMTDRLSRSGARAFVIRNVEPNDARIVQWVRVLPASFYKLEAWVMTRDVTGDSSAGASICVMGEAKEPNYALGSGDEWMKLEVYGRTGPAQTLIPVALRLGFYGKLAKGSAAFDDVNVVRVDAVPEGAILHDFQDSGALASVVPASGLVPLSSIIAILIVIGVVLLLLALYVFRYKLLDLAIGAMEGGIRAVNRVSAAEGGEDKRLCARIPAEISAFFERPVRGGGSRIVEFITKDISRDGCLVITDDIDFMEIGDRAECALKVGERRYRVGQVQLVRKQKGIRRSGGVKELGLGMRFISRSSSDRGKITKAIRAILRSREQGGEAAPAQDAGDGKAKP